MGNYPNKNTNGDETLIKIKYNAVLLQNSQISATKFLRLINSWKLASEAIIPKNNT